MAFSILTSMGSRLLHKLKLFAILVMLFVSMLTCSCGIIDPEPCEKSSYCNGDELWYCYTGGEHLGGNDEGIKEDCSQTDRICMDEEDGWGANCYYPNTQCPADVRSYCDGDVVHRCVQLGGLVTEQIDCKESEQFCVQDGQEAYCTDPCEINSPPECRTGHILKSCVDGLWTNKMCPGSWECLEIKYENQTFAACFSNEELCEEFFETCSGNILQTICNGKQSELDCVNGCYEVVDLNGLDHIYCAQ